MSAADGEALIREATDADSDAVIALIDLCWSAYPGVVLDVDRDEPGLRRVASHFRGQGGAFWTAWRAGALRGSVGYSVGAQSVELLKLYVHPEERRSGFGRRLIGLVELAAEARGVACVELWTDTRFTTAHRFYDSLGYRRSGGCRSLHDASRSMEYHYIRRIEVPA